MTERLAQHPISLSEIDALVLSGILQQIIAGNDVSSYGEEARVLNAKLIQGLEERVE